MSELSNIRSRSDFHYLSDLCTECIGFSDDSQCIEVCPANCILSYSEHQEGKEELLEKKNRIHDQ